MSSSSFGSNIPAPDAVQVVVSALADESPLVRQASMASLKDIAKLNPLLVLDCCSSVSRGGRRRFGNMSGVFQVMAFAVSAMDNKDVDPGYMLKLAKIATTEMISSKEYDVEWQRAASSLLVSIGMHLPDLMMEEIFQHLSGTSSSSPSMIQVLADFASSDVYSKVKRSTFKSPSHSWKRERRTPANIRQCIQVLVSGDLPVHYGTCFSVSA